MVEHCSEARNPCAPFCQWCRAETGPERIVLQYDRCPSCKMKWMPPAPDDACHINLAADIDEKWHRVRPIWTGCAHPQDRLVAHVSESGVRRRKYQCTVCGDQSRGRVDRKTAPSIETLPLWDYELRTVGRAAARAAWLAVSVPWQNGYAADKRATWWSRYNEYLSSQEWALLRAMVIERDAGDCQLCGAPGVHVHHFTYVRVTREALEDLVLLCVPCHEAMHGNSDSGAARG